MKVFNLAEELEKERKKNKELQERINKVLKYIENTSWNSDLHEVEMILKGSDNNE